MTVSYVLHSQKYRARHQVAHSHEPKIPHVHAAGQVGAAIIAAPAEGDARLRRIPSGGKDPNCMREVQILRFLE